MFNKNELIVSDQIINDIMTRRKLIIQLISNINSKIKASPNGYLRVVKKWNSYQYYQRSSKKDVQGKYLPQNQLPLATALAQKDYDTKLLAALEKQLRAIDKFIKDYDPAAPAAIYEDLTAPRKQLVTPVFVGDEDYEKQWLSVPYEKMGFKPDDPVFYTDRGERVRSKSEVLIANELYRHGIPYRYEYPVYINGVKMAVPDFNCLNVRLRKEYYWEHLGMMGKEEYANRNAAKIEKYTLAKDFDETSLILTFETDRHPLNTRVIEEKIRTYLV
ncbi:MAG: hypothetical protein J6113_02040 [Lachnospiraceae bacterium]|nr:hypothetical protein [Lachnospiraceae bacterium]